MKVIQTVVLIILSSFIVSCKKDKPEEQKPQEEKPVINEKCLITYGPIFTNTLADYRYTYNADGNITIIQELKRRNDTNSTSTIYMLTYNTQKRLTRLDEKFRYGGYHNLFYNADGTLQKIDYYGIEYRNSSELKLMNYKTFSYNAQMQLEKIGTYNSRNTIMANEFYFYDTKGNVIKRIDSTIVTSRFAQSYMAEYKYDNNRNPYHNLQLYPVISLAGKSPNNIVYIKEESTNNGNRVVKGNAFTYNYNQNNLPENIAYQVTGAQGTLQATDIFGYRCQ